MSVGAPFQGTKKAIMTTGWAEAMERYGIEENDICLFDFLPAKKGRKLELNIIKI